ncbi:FAD binding domain-containing protein [Pseudogemmobacter sonorensis]|uniref:FAD binding domain-containing protein n=1 Tax=Pseudogemmobacter sonorensis TaxID=2989681 RepID=UPI003674675A
MTQSPAITTPAIAPLTSPGTVEEALALLHAGGAGTRAIAGATWIMRGPTRGEPVPARLVALNRIAELQGVEIGAQRARIGAMASHDLMARSLPDAPDLHALARAAGASANPGIRRLATLGGNLCATGFVAADLVPALMCLDARIGIATAEGRRDLDMAEFMALRRGTTPFLVTHATFARSARRSAHARTPARDYPVAIASLALTLDTGGRIATIRLALGAVEADARRWTAFEARAVGKSPDPAAMAALARDLAGGLAPVTALDAPGWYRAQILPALVGRAFGQIVQEG